MKAKIPETRNRNIKVAICVYITNAAETIRAIEIAKAIITNATETAAHRCHCHVDGQLTDHAQASCKSTAISRNEDTAASPDDVHGILDLRFFTYRGSLPGGPKRTIDYEHLIHAEGFEVEYFGSVYKKTSSSFESNQNIDAISLEETAAAVLNDEMWQSFLNAERNREGIFPPPYDNRAAPYLRAIMGTLQEFQPDMVVYGLFPEVAIACAIGGWRRVSFATVPLEIFRDWRENHQDLMHELGLVNVDSERKVRNDPLGVIRKAAIECGLVLASPPSDNDAKTINSRLMEAISPNHSLVCDFQCYYNERSSDIPLDVTIVGPIVSSDMSSSTDVEKIQSFLLGTTIDVGADPIRPIKVLLTMGSTAKGSLFLEALKTLCHAKVGTFRSVVMLPASLCHHSDEAAEIIGTAESRNDMFLTKSFVPVRPILQNVDVVLCHGGQLTIQCTMAAGVPVVGAPSHFEQLFNLQNCQRCGSGVCIMPIDWDEDNIRKKLLDVGNHTSTYRNAANRMKEKFLRSGDGATRAGLLIWDMIDV